jgi:hypothetical protein
MTMLKIQFEKADISVRHARPCAGHPRLSFALQDVDGRDEPGHDELIQFDVTRKNP